MDMILSKLGEIVKDREAQRAAVHGVTESDTTKQLSHKDSFKMVWRPCQGLPWWLRRWRICLQCTRHRFSPWVAKIPWRRERPPASVFLPEEFSGQRSLAGYNPWDLKELDMTEQLSLSISRLCQSGVPPYCCKYIKSKLSFAWLTSFYKGLLGSIIDILKKKIINNFQAGYVNAKYWAWCLAYDKDSLNGGNY